MDKFLADWDDLCDEARFWGEPMYMWAYDGPAVHSDELLESGLRLVARTMHPAFMSGMVPKFDPVRDGCGR